MLAACKPLILLDFHRSFNDTRTNRSILWGTPIFYFLNCSVIVVRKRATFCLFSPTYKKRDFYRFFMIARPKGKSSRDFPFCFVKFHTEHLVCVRFDGKGCSVCGVETCRLFIDMLDGFPGKSFAEVCVTWYTNQLEWSDLTGTCGALQAGKQT